MSEDNGTPRAPEAEKQVVASILLLPEILPEVAAIVRPFDFFEARERATFQAMHDLHTAGKPIEHAMIVDMLRGLPDFGTENPAGYLMELVQSVATAAHGPHYAKEVRDKRERRDRIRQLMDWGDQYRNGHATGDVDKDLFAAATDWQREREAVRPRDKYSYRDLQHAFPNLNMVVVDGWARQGETVNIIAPSKFGKSWLLHYILLCIVTGRKIFGQFATTKGKCILFDNELHEPTLAHRIAVVAGAMGLGLKDYQDDLEVWPLRGRLPSLFDLQSRILDEVEPGTVQAIGVDALYRIMPPGASENDNGAMKEVYNVFDAIGGHTLGANFIIHHSSKGSQTDKRVTDVGAGAGSQSRAADTHLVLREHEEAGIAVLDAAVRSFAPMEPLAIRWAFPLWHPADDVDPSKLKGKQTRTEERQGDKDREGLDTTLTALVDGPAGLNEACRRTGMGKERQRRLLNMLCANDQATFTEVTINGVKCHEYTIKK